MEELLVAASGKVHSMGNSRPESDVASAHPNIQQIDNRVVLTVRVNVNHFDQSLLSAWNCSDYSWKLQETRT